MVGPGGSDGIELPDRDRNVMTKTKKKTRLTYRLRGLPPDVDEKHIRDRLLEKLKVQNAQLHSLCNDCSDAREKVATVEFMSKTPDLLTNDPDDDEWSFEYDGQTQASFDSHFTGFTPLYHPEDPNDHEIDFIAIHGLGGHPLGSWKNRKSSYMWLRDSLPLNFKNCRVLIYGYRARVVHSHSYETIDEIASHFCDLLLDIRRAESSRHKPIIFAAHSLGGLVLKSAIGQMKDRGDEEMIYLLRSVHSILCFGVPNQGMDISHILAMIKGQEILPLVISLSKDPQSLRPINEKFNDAFSFQDSVVVSFYETEVSPTMQQGHDGEPVMTGERVQLVDKWSADNSRKGIDDPRTPINRNHSNMVKFTARDDLYPVVRQRLEKLVFAAPAVISKRLSEGIGSINCTSANGSDRERSSSPVSDDDVTVQAPPFRDAVPTPTPSRRMKARQKSPQRTIRVLEMLNEAMMPLFTQSDRESAMIWAVELGHLDCVKYILDRRTDPDTQSEDGMLMLGIAAKNGHAALLQLLLDYQANINLTDDHGRTALFFAAGYGHLKIVEDLIRQGALLETKVHPRAKPGAFQMTPLMNAARFGQLDVADCLLDEGADIDAQTANGGYSALHYAVMGSKLNAVEFMLDKGADISKRTLVGATSLILASTYCSRDADQLVALALIRAGADLSAQDNSGFSALHYAVSLKNVELCRLLVLEGAKSSLRGPRGLTALHMAVYQGKQPVIDALFNVSDDHSVERAETEPSASSPPLQPSEMLDDNGFSPYDLNTSNIRLPLIPRKDSRASNLSHHSSNISLSSRGRQRHRSPKQGYDRRVSQDVATYEYPMQHMESVPKFEISRRDVDDIDDADNEAPALSQTSPE